MQPESAFIRVNPVEKLLRLICPELSDTRRGNPSVRTHR
jgi:hypothetical protein